MSPSHFLKIHFNITLPSLPVFQVISFPGLPHQSPVGTSPVPHTCHMPRLSHDSWYDQINDVRCGVQSNTVPGNFLIWGGYNTNSDKQKLRRNFGHKNRLLTRNTEYRILPSVRRTEPSPQECTSLQSCKVGKPPDRRGLQGPYLRQRLCTTFYFTDFAHRPVSKLGLLLLLSKMDGAQSPWSILILFHTLYFA